MKKQSGKNLFKKIKNFLLGQNQKQQIFAIICIAVLAIWQLLFYFFSWEEFGFFYAYQQSDYASTVFNAHGFKNHPIIPHLAFLFYLFDYNPLPYHILTIIIFSLLSVSVYMFAKEIAQNQKISFFSGIIFAAGYFGIGTFTTDTYSGFIGGIGLIILLWLLILFLKLIRRWKIKHLVIFIGLYILEAYFFPDRSFAFPGLAFIIIYFKTRNIFKSFIICALLFLPFIIFLKYQVGTYASSIPHIQFRIFEFIKSVIGTFGNLFFPSTITGKDGVSITVGIIMLLIGLINSKTRLLLFLTLTSICAQLLAVLVNSQYFFVVQSPAHFMASFTIFSSIIIAILLHKHIKIFIGVVIIIIIFSNMYVYDILQNHSNILRYFYETIQKKLPNPEGKTAVLIYTAEPRPLSPFIHLPEINGEVYVSGFYHKNARDMKVTQGWPDAIDYLKKNKLSPDNFYVYYYTQNNLEDVSNDVRNSIKVKNPIEIINYQNANVVGLMPLQVDIKLNEKPLVPVLEASRQDLFAYFNWHKNIKVETFPTKSYEDRTKEAIIDRDFNTTWIPNNWEKPVFIILNLPEALKIDKIFWAVSRTSSWPARTPTDYAFFVSEDKEKWTKVKEVKSGKELQTSEYNIEDISYDREVSYLKFEIYKTFEGSLPAIDDILILPENYKKFSYEEIYDYFNQMSPQVCLQWQTESAPNFGPQKQFCQKVEFTDTIHMTIEPRTKKITGFKIIDQNNKELKAEWIKITYPYFEEN